MHPATLLLLLLLALPSQGRAETVDTDYFSVELADEWQLLQNTHANTIAITVLSTRSRDTLVTLVVGESGGAGLTRVTNCFARQYKATWGPSYREDLATFTYRDYEGADGTVYVCVQDSLYMVIAASGNQNKAKKLMQNISSENYPELIPR